METLDSGIGSRSPTPPDSSLSQTNSSKVTKVATQTHHINNNSHNNTSSSETNGTSKGKGSEKADVLSANTSNGGVGTTGSSSNSQNNSGASNSNSRLHGNNTSNNSKTYRDYNNRHSAGHGQYKKYQSQHYGYGGHYQRYNGNGHRNYGNNKHYYSSTNYHHYQGYHHQQYAQQQNHHNHHHGHNNNNSNSNSSGNNNNGGTYTNAHYHHQHHHNQHQHNHQYFNSHSGGAGHPQYHHQNRNAPPHVIISSDADALSWQRRGGDSHNGNWSSPSLEPTDPSVQISLNLSALKQGFYSPSPQNASPATSPSTTDSSDAYSIQEETGSTSGVVVSSHTSSSRLSNNNSSIDSFNYSSNGGAVEAGVIGTSISLSDQAATGYHHYATFHPSGFYTYPSANSGQHGRSMSHHQNGHHQLASQNLGLLMPADSSYSLGKADSSISSGSSDKTLEWSDDGTFLTTSSSNGSNSDREDYLSSSAPTDRCSTPDFIYAPSLSLVGHAPTKKRFYNGSACTTGKLSPTPQNQRFHHYPRKMAYQQLQQSGFPREWFDDLDPEDYVRAFSRFGEVKERPIALAQNPQSDSLSEGIWLKFAANQQTTETFRRKMELWRDVYRIVRTLNNNAHFKHDPRNFPAFGLQVVGSTMSGFGSNNSDVDMCLLVRGTDVDQRYEAVDKLQVLYGALSASQWLDNVEMIYAKVPILKFRDPKRSLEIDLNCNNFVGIRNTHLLYCYSQADWRLKPLVLVVKLWAHYHGINDAKNMTISSYSLVLMVIHFLQCGIEEPVLPVLQQMYPDKFNSTSNILQVKINEILPPWQSKNKETIGNLLIQFLEYYARKFDYSENAVSIRTGGTIPIKQAALYKSLKNDPHQWKYLCIEEPFDRTNTARSVYDRDIFDKIVGIFNLSYQRLLASRNLEAIFTPISEVDARTMAVLLR